MDMSTEPQVTVGMYAPPKELIVYHKTVSTVLKCLLLLSNGSILVCFVKCRHLRIKRYMFVGSLCSANFVFGAFELVPTKTTAVGGCSVIEFSIATLVTRALLIVSLCHVIMIGLDRFISLTFPLRYQSLMTTRVIGIIVVLLWSVPLGSCIARIIPFFLDGIGFVTCSPEVYGRDVIVLLIVMYIILFTELVVIYRKIWHIAKQAHASRGIRSGRPDTTNHKANKVVGFILSSFVVLISPAVAFVIFQFLGVQLILAI